MSKEIAVEQYNRCWELLERESLSNEEQAELITAAFASRFHWSPIGKDMNLAIADWMVSRAAVALGDPVLCVQFALLAVERTESSDMPMWMKASAYEGLARAYSVSGEGDLRDDCIQKASDYLQLETDEEDREVIASQLATVPRN